MGNKFWRKRQVVDEKYTRPQGLYQLKDVDHKKLKKLILDSKLAPCYPGDESECGGYDLEECPICFLCYPSLNRSRCCLKGICTECYLQMKTTNSIRPIQCPFCKTSNYNVEYRGGKTEEEKGKEQIEEQRVIEAKIRMRQQELLDDEDRKQKIPDISSSSMILAQGEVGYDTVAVRNKALWKAEKEKEQEKKDRDRIRRKLQQDKVQTTELMVDWLKSLKRNHEDDGTKARRAFQTLLIYITNVTKNPDEEKFRKIRISNPAFQERVGNMKEGTGFLELCGFERVGGILFLPIDKVDMEVLKSAGTALNSAITNPFFGLLSK